MRNISLIAALLTLMSTQIVFAGTPEKAYLDHWPQWRGPLATGVAPNASPPVQWGHDQHIRWRVVLPGQGHAAPIVWGDRIFILTAAETESPGDPEKTTAVNERFPDWMKQNNLAVRPEQVVAFAVLALDRNDGSIVWMENARVEQPHEGTHRDATWASNSPITDGEHLFAHFGSRGLYCYDLDGNLKWKVDLGDMTTRNGFGEGSSPALYGDVLVVNWDHEGDSFIVALDKNTGEQLWKKERDEVTSWSTPVVVQNDGKPQVVVNATTATRGYDLHTGEVMWELDGMTVNTIPSPVANDGIVYVTSGYRGSILQAVRWAEANGDVRDSSALLWQYERDTPYVPSPLLYGDHLYFLKTNKGILTNLDAETGEILYGPKRLDDIQNIYASPVGADGKVYLTSREGTTVVLKNEATFEVLAVNRLSDRFDSSAAIAGDAIYLRGYDYLYCIAED